MSITSGWYADPEHHHDGWFKYYKFKGIREIWFGHRWIAIEWS